MTCRDFIIDLLADYLDQTLGRDVAADVERHLDGCPACVAYMNTYEQTRRLTRRTQAVAMPDDMRARLRAFLADQLSKRGG